MTRRGYLRGMLGFGGVGFIYFAISRSAERSSGEKLRLRDMRCGSTATETTFPPVLFYLPMI